MSSKKKVATEVERTLSAEAVAALLEGIARGMRSNQVRLQGDEPVDLHPGSVVKVKLEAKEKVEKGSLTLKMTWRPPLMAGPASVLHGVKATAATVVSRDVVDEALLEPQEAEADEEYEYEYVYEEVVEAAEEPTPKPSRPRTASGASKKAAAKKDAKKRGASKSRTQKKR